MVRDAEQLLDELYNAFEPSEPLLAGDPTYVDCRAVRGDGDIVIDVGRKIYRSKRITCQLYAGHRGAGKSTELLRLKQDLEDNHNFHVVYFAADREDIDSENTQYTDILLACTRHILEDLNGIANPSPLLNWLKSRWQELQSLALTEVQFDRLNVQGQIAQFAKLTANLRAVPNLRQQIRAKVDPHTVTLIEALNEFIDEANKKLPNGRDRLAVIVDSLDRIAFIPREGGRNNYDEIFLDRSEQLKKLNCHAIYTVPISMAYSNRANDLKEIYNDPQVLPMIMVRTPQGDIEPSGFDKIKELLAKRVRLCTPTRSLETEVFDSEETVKQLCLISGGHLRELMLLMQETINRTENLPIPARSVQRAITKVRDVYRRTVESSEWEILAEVARRKQIRNDEQHRSLLFRRCILEYRYFDEEGELQPWYDVHPLILGIQQFQDALAQIQ